MTLRTGPRIGLSSGSAPQLGATALAALVRDLGGTAVDVRAGKGHGWEEGGLAGLRAAGVEICFVGLSTVLGDPGHPPSAVTANPWPEPELPVKAFAAAGCTAPDRLDLTLAQIAALADRVGDPARVLVETHHGYALVPELADLCVRTGVGILLDTLGLARIHPDPVAAAAELAPWTAYAQVKGFDQATPGVGGHLPLRSSCAALTRDVLAAVPTLRAVTVETRAGSLADDIALLTEWFTDSAVPLPALEKEPLT
ncbi:hypothetical protein ACFW9N_44155 [Streptomyces sp. NPDC059496]|uniref:hypothetical protein n=1 Tax=Streptomyces sp. NPDC059496 TaxID=3346851 RepID=UPI0036B6DD3E